MERPVVAPMVPPRRTLLPIEMPVPRPAAAPAQFQRLVPTTDAGNAPPLPNAQPTTTARPVTPPAKPFKGPKNLDFLGLPLPPPRLAP